MPEFIRLAEDEGLFELTLDRPPLNILHGPMMAELSRAFEVVAEHRDVKLLLIRAEGKAFSAGADIDEHRPDKVHGMIAQFHGIFRVLERVPFPTVAFVHGAALGGGCELALGCDMIVATERAKFGQPEVGLGFLPPVAAAILPARVGWSRAVEICCGGQALKAQEAFAAGLVNHVFTADVADEALHAFLAPFLRQSPTTLRLIKKALRGGGQRAFLDRLEVAERVFLDELMTTDDVLEGLAAFAEKREPTWKNR